MDRITNVSSVTQATSDSAVPTAETERVLAELQQNGVIVLPNLILPQQLSAMQDAFNSRLQRIRWNDFEGYEKERYRHVVPDLLTIEQAFVEIALHPLI